MSLRLIQRVAAHSKAVIAMGMEYMKTAIKTGMFVLLLGIMAFPVILRICGYLDWPLWLTILSPLGMLVVLALCGYLVMGILFLRSGRKIH